MPDYAIKEWSESNTLLEPGYLRSAHNARSWSRLSNYVRLHALYEEGGIYLDTDVEVLRPFDPLLRHKCFAGFQVKDEYQDWVNMAVMGAEAGHPFLQLVRDHITEHFAATGEFCRGPLAATNVLREMGLQQYGRQAVGGVDLLPTDYFYPYAWTEEFTPDRVTEDTYCIHHWEGTWMVENHRSLVHRVLSRLSRALKN